MIVEQLLDWLEAAIMWALSGLPSLDVDYVENLNMIAENLGSLNYFLPIAETFALVVGVLFIFPLFMGVSLMLWVMAQLRGSSSRG